MFTLFSWAEWNYFVDQAKSHHQPVSGFWDAEHIHDWAYNAASNWQSELLFGVVIVALLHKVHGEEDQT